MNQLVTDIQSLPVESNTPKPDVLCPSCGDPFTDKEADSQHVQTHRAVYVYGEVLESQVLSLQYFEKRQLMHPADWYYCFKCKKCCFIQ